MNWKLWLDRRLLNEMPSEGGGEGSGAASSASESSSSEADGFDEFGYPINKTGEAPPPPPVATTPPPEQKAGEAAPKATATGYDEEPAQVDPPPPPPPKEEEKIDLGFELKTDGLSPEEAQQLKQAFKADGFNEKQAQAMVALRVNQINAENAAKAERERVAVEAQKAQRSEWHRELKTDPTFGGEKFAFNVQQAGKVVEEFMPNTKKVLTERKTMLPPYVMRDLAKLSETLFASQSLVQGSAVVPQKEEGPDDHLDFYK